ncbi:hypothetical protein [Hyalangium sp.]|uniref:hypothetical protein n=1 Tax=Hyalangium sp. TaxID=2028555 RepID=UPI002D56E800|nr:hypothetical protein [Hyalangium sp.]HYH97446.1 hypothetical protein [Hyalangium sp.]
MSLREWGTLFLVLLTACSGAPRVAYSEGDSYEAALAAARYELRVLTPDTGQPMPVVVPKEHFQRAMRALASEIPLSTFDALEN